MTGTTYRPHQTVGFIGLGMMGSRMIQHLKGYASRLLVYDTDSDRARQCAQTAGAESVPDILSMQAADIVVLMLPSSMVVDQVVRGADGKPGLLDILSPGAMIIDMSSSTPANTIENARMASERGLTYMDAPVSGGPAGAETAKLAIMAGGSETDFAHAKPLLEKLGANMLRAGEVGAGHAVKALNNLLAATILAATSEVFAAGEKFGLDPEVMHRIVNASSGGSFMTNFTWPRAVLPKTYNFGFAIQLMNKDVGIAMSLIESMGMDTTLAQASAQMWRNALDQSHPTADITELTRQLQRKAGLTV